MKIRVRLILCFAFALAASSHATTIWHGDPNYSHFSILTPDDVILRIEGDTFSINSSIRLVGGGGGPVGYQVNKTYDLALVPDAGWQFTAFHGSATDRGSYRNSPVYGGYALDTEIALAGLSFSTRYENYNWGSGGSWTITPFSPWAQSYAIDPAFANGLTVHLYQNLYVTNDGYLDTDAGFSFGMVYDPNPPSTGGGNSVPDSGSTGMLLGCVLGGMVIGRRCFQSGGERPEAKG